MAMMGDGKTKYNHDLDGDTNSLGGCSVHFQHLTVPSHMLLTRLFPRQMFAGRMYPLRSSLHTSKTDILMSSCSIKLVCDLSNRFASGRIERENNIGNEWTDCFRLDGFSLPQSPFVGFSALTGDVYDSHE